MFFYFTLVVLGNLWCQVPDATHTYWRERNQTSVTWTQPYTWLASTWKGCTIPLGIPPSGSQPMHGSHRRVPCSQNRTTKERSYNNGKHTTLWHALNTRILAAVPARFILIFPPDLMFENVQQTKCISKPKNVQSCNLHRLRTAARKIQF